ncbi:alpha/beta hydrolase [Mycolicibacterium mengxianglii]|uniref:alpha/beta hydrolase n=1 Tax=Mycolicibacterium mengxianglii TaxID=2736649 RepID=UPI0018EEDF5C|nr:alpha/beta hydrolase [Mycolicibacterium mengxianglii]
MTDVIARMGGRRPLAREAPRAIRLVGKVLTVLPARLAVLLSGRRPIVVDGNPLDPTLQLFLTLLRRTGVTGMLTGSGDAVDVAKSRAGMRDTCIGLGGPGAPVEVENLSAPGPAGPLGIRRYRSDPAAVGAVPALVYFHGGGFVVGDLDCYDALCRRLCRDLGVDVFSVDYRLAPQHKAPAAVEDCCAAYEWLVTHAADLGVCADRIVVGGDSAGGALTAVVTHWARDQARNRPLAQPCLQLLIYPVTVMTAQTRSRTLFAAGYLLTGADMDTFARLYVEGSGLAGTDPRVSPLLARDLSGLPPAIVITAGYDPLRDEGEQYAEALVQAGVSVTHLQMGGMIHGFINFPGLGGGVERSLAEVISTVGAHLQGFEAG